jgi:1,4-alpha-glucan branching enzyme
MTKTHREKRSPAIRFACHAPEAKAVFLAGTFNGWDSLATPMEKDSEGNWSAELRLPPGTHEFKFVVDGEWCCEPNCDKSVDCPHCVPNDFGTMNRLIEVTES